MYKNAFDARGLHPKNLSRALGNSGTLTSPLIPWNTCGAFMHATLGVNPLAYLPFAFFNLIIPFIAIFYGFAGITMEKLGPGEREEYAGRGQVEAEEMPAVANPPGNPSTE
jgi:Na+:H+ antiporter, NhaC family